MVRGRPHTVVVRRWGRIVVIAPGGREVSSWPLEGVGRPGLAVIDELARLQLVAKRAGYGARLRDACTDLAALVDLAGLAGELLEVVGQPERGEERRVEEVVEPDDLVP